ncbi:hypothetical protein [Terriglobus albidus]|uniref:hypothetical protein n=1 Tax=Terriglobus albidus TaxID=1592106 RepID=UPI0021E069E0|nr:hypothetical protein [Terriglobus albidus]
MTREQLDLARRRAFGLDSNALLILEDARAWVDRMGLVLWTPKTQLAAPAPVFVSAVSGVAEPGVAEAEAAKQMLGRLVREGAAVPLLLLGGAAPGDIPDFVVSAAALPYLYTLRGDKSWKAAPAASSLSPLALKVWGVLKSKGPQTVSNLLPELGRELTHAAVLRALSELWAMLRVIPVYQDGEEETQWELLTARFTKQIKAGGNAGVPTALSAMISLYLTAVLVAELDEIEAFLSPLVARSKVRDAVSGLNAARQLDEVVLEGKTLLHIRGELPEMPEIVPVEVSAEGASEEGDTIDVGDVGEAEPDRENLLERARQRTEKTFTEDRRRVERRPAAREGERPARRSSRAEEGTEGAERKPFRPRKEFGDRKPFDGERRPFRPREAGEGSERPARRSFGGDRDRKPFQRKPFDGERKPFRPREEGEGSERPARRSFGGDRDRKPFQRKPFDGERKPFRPREEGEGSERPARRSFGGDRDRKPFQRKPFDGERKPFRPREEGEGSERPARRSFGGDRDRKPFQRKPFDGERKPFRKREEGEGGERPSRRSFGGDRERKPFQRKPFDGERKPFRKREEGEGSERPARRSFGGDRDRKPFDGERKPFRKREEGGEGGERPARRSFGGDRDRKPFQRKPFDGERKPFRKREEGAGEDRPRRTFKADGGKPSFGGKKFGGAPKKFGGAPKKFGSKPGGRSGAPKKFGKPGAAKPFRKKRESDE